MRVGILAVAALIVSASAVAVGPPAATLEAMQQALEVFERGDLAGSARITTRAVVSKPDGSAREESEEVRVMTLRPGETESRLVASRKNGKDTLAERKDRVETRKVGTIPDRGKGGKERRDDLVLPTGPDAASFIFSPPRVDGVLTVSDFAPGAALATAKGASRGRVAWRHDDGEPAWLEVAYVEPPTGLKEFTLRFEFARAGDVRYPRFTRTVGVGGMLWIRRAFDVTVEISEAELRSTR